MEETNPNHINELPRLNRVIGQLDGIKRMIENQRKCTDILVQLKAARSAILTIEKTILSKHLETCVAESFNDQATAKEKIKEIESLFDKLQAF